MLQCDTDIGQKHCGPTLSNAVSTVVLSITTIHYSTMAVDPTLGLGRNSDDCWCTSLEPNLFLRFGLYILQLNVKLMYVRLSFSFCL